jgi:hypothetical protein
MKIAVKSGLLSSVACALLLSLSAHAETTVLDMANKVTAEKVAVAAQTQPSTPPAGHTTTMPIINAPSVAAVNVPKAPAVASVAAPTSAAPVLVAVPVPVTPPVAVASAAPVSAAPVSASVVKLDNPTRTVNDKEVPSQVQDVVEKLRGAKVDLSLEDMNQARAALARLDLLLELEQKMHDLQAARAKNDGAAMGGPDISAYLPAQVAAMNRRGNMPTPIPVAMPVMDSAPVPIARHNKSKSQPPQYEIQRINGLNGKYSVVLKSLVDSKVSTVKVGDALSDGTMVQSITPINVRLKDPEDGRLQTLTIENVSAMSSGRGVQ